MPAPPWANTFETGLADGTAITVANSDDGNAGNAFTGVDGTVKFSTAQARGGLSAIFEIPASPVSMNLNVWGLGAIASPNDLYGRFYMWLPNRPGTNPLRIVRFFTDVGATSAYLVIRSDTGYLDVFDASGTGNLGGIGSIECAYAHWIRAEFRVRSSVTAGEMEWRLFNDPDSTSTTDSKSVTGAVFGANIHEAEFGNPAAALAPPSYTFYMDDIALSTTGWIGPSSGGFSGPGSYKNILTMGVG